MGKSAKPPPPPDTTRFSQTAENQSRQMQQWANSMWESGQQQWGQLQNWASTVMGMALPAMEDSFQWARDQQQRYEQYAVPAIESLFSEAELYASKGEEDRQRAAAVQDVKSATEAQRQAQLRELEGYGIDPSETRYQALDAQGRIAEAAMSALAANQAGERTKQIGRNLRSEAIGVGERMQGQGQQSQQLASGMGTSSLGAATGANVGGMQVAQGALPYMSGSVGANQVGAGIVDTAYANQLGYTDATNRANQMDFDNFASLGSSLGSLATMGFPLPKPTGAAEGGEVMAPGGPTQDAGAIAISDGEYVIPADVVKKLGTNYFDKMIEKETGRQPPGAKQAIPLPQGGQQKVMPGSTPMHYSNAGVLA